MESETSHCCSPRSSCQPPAEDWWRTSPWVGSSRRASPVTTATTWRATGCSRPRRARGSTFTLRRWRWPRMTIGEQETEHVDGSECSINNYDHFKCVWRPTSAEAKPPHPRKKKTSDPLFYISCNCIFVRACAYPLQIWWRLTGILSTLMRIMGSFDMSARMWTIPPLEDGVANEREEEHCGEQNVREWNVKYWCRRPIISEDTTGCQLAGAAGRVWVSLKQHGVLVTGDWEEEPRVGK